MKILVNTDVLMDAAEESEYHAESKQFLRDLIASPELSPWVSAASLINVHNAISKRDGRDNSKAFLKYIEQSFAIIPFRNSTFVDAIAEDRANFEDQIQISSAESLGMDCVVTRKIDSFKKSRIPVLTPAAFVEKWKTGQFDTITRVPFMDLGAQHHQIYNEIDDRITEIITSNGFILGKHVDEFEQRFAELQGAKFCIGVSSGTDALHVALLALGIGPGDGVILPVNTFIATAEPVSLTGAVPVFVDCDQYYNMDVVKIREFLENQKRKADSVPIKVIIPVHLYGQPARMNEIMALAGEFGLMVIEDCCQAHLAEWQGRKVGNFGAFGAFSFYPGKNLGAYGEAGALITNDEDLYHKARMIRQHGEIERYHHQVVGHNYRMEAIQGAVLAAKLRFLREWTEKRRKNACLYNELLKGIEGIRTPNAIEHAQCVHHLYVIQSEDRDGLREYLQQHGIATGLHYPIPLHLQTAYKELGYKEGDFPVAEQAAGKILSLPMFPELTGRQIRYVCDKIKEFMSKQK